MNGSTIFSMNFRRFYNMNLLINQAININVFQKEDLFLHVKRDLGIKVISQFFRNGDLICQSSLITYFLKQHVEIEYQNLPDNIHLFRQRGWYYSLMCENVEYSLKIKPFRRPAFRLYANGQVIGTIGGTNSLTLEGRNYEMRTDSEDENINVILLILFLFQLRAF